MNRLFEILDSPELFSEFNWQEWLDIRPPYEQIDFSVRDVTTRISRNGYEWDAHGLLYQPAREVDSDVAIVIIHGGAGSSRGKDTTPDGRPGIARVLAGQRFRVLSLDYIGHYPRGGIWLTPIEMRQPIYLLDRELTRDEICDRNLKCTYNVHLQAFGTLVDQHLAGRKLLAFGHSTGGPMAADLHLFTTKTSIIGLIGFGSSGPSYWRQDWVEQSGQPYRDMPLDAISRRSVESFRSSGYEGLPEMTPWGNAEAVCRWSFHVRSQIKTGLCDNQMLCALPRLQEYAAITGLPVEEYTGYLGNLDAKWLQSIGVFLLCSENDRIHWIIGDRLKDKHDVYMAHRYAAFTPRVRVSYVPKYSHYGIFEFHNENIAYAWLWAFKRHFFENETG